MCYHAGKQDATTHLGKRAQMLANRGRTIAAAERGDRDAFLGLYDQFGPMLYRFFFWLTGNESESRELVVATFRRAIRTFRKRPRDMVLDTWFYRTAVATFLASARWHRLTRRAAGPVEIEDRTTAWRAAVIALPPRLRVVWLLSLAEGMPQSQTAEAVGVSLERVDSLLERARAEYRAPEPDADRATVERAMRQFRAPRPGASLRGEIAAALGTSDATLRSRVMQITIGLVVLALVASVAFSLLRGPEEEEATPEQADTEPKTIVVLGAADTGALIAFDPKSLRPNTVTGVGGEPRGLALSADGAAIYILQEDGLLMVDAQSQQVGRLVELPSQAWSALAIAGQYVVLGSLSATSLVAVTESDEAPIEIPLPWSVDTLVPLSSGAILAVAVDRAQMVRITLDSQSVGEAITVGTNLVLGAVVPTADARTAYVTTPESEEIWRVDLRSGQAVLFTATPAARASHGALSADGSALYLSMAAGPDSPSQNQETSTSADIKSTAPASSTPTAKDSSSGETDDEEPVEEVGAPALTMISTADGSVERELWQGGGITQMALDPDRDILYALAPHANAILVMDAKTLHVRNAVPLAVRPVAFVLTAEDAQ